MPRALSLGVIAMASIVIASNILVQHQLGNWLTYGALTYPFAFLVTDIFNRIYGASEARRVVLAGFVVGVICSLIGSQIHGEFGPLVTLRIAMGSGIAFLIAHLVDILVFQRLRRGIWWRAPLVSTIVGSALDTALFFTIAFSMSLSFLESGNDVSWAAEMLPMLGLGPVVPLWVSLGVADFGVKLTLALIALIPFRILVTRILGARTA